jgi:hypothetical protein
MKKSVKATTWKVSAKNEDECHYRIQIEGITTKKEEKQVLKATKGWEPSGRAYYPKGKERVLLFSKKFSDRGSLLEWAQTFPFELQEQTVRGNNKKIKTAVSA